MQPILFTPHLLQYHRRLTRAVNIGDVPLGANHPIRIQSMTTVDTMDTKGSVAQCIRMIEAGCEYIRITAPSIKEAENLGAIKQELRKLGFKTPLIADIHFTPNAAELAARLVEKVRINPGNYIDKKKFESLEYSDSEYEAEIEKIRSRFAPLVKICKEYGTAMRIGTNHGSLSDRIMSRYGDTPLGMVESALEFLRICEDMQYYDIVISMKSSNPQVMVQAYRLLVQKLNEGNFQPYPLHLGVTEAGEAEDGRIKSALGIGTLLEDGLGDTVRVSLTEEPEKEAPVAKALIDRYTARSTQSLPRKIDFSVYHPYEFKRRTTQEVLIFGLHHVPRVVADFSAYQSIAITDLAAIGHYYLPEPDKWTMVDTGADFLYTGSHPVSFMLPNGLKEILDFETWKVNPDRTNTFPLLTWHQIDAAPPSPFFLRLSTDTYFENIHTLRQLESCILLLYSNHDHAYADFRSVFLSLNSQGIDLPVIIERKYDSIDTSLLHGATDIGGLLIDGMGDGVMLQAPTPSEIKMTNEIAFGILQAARTRTTKTEYISCPSCGRTLFDLQETTAMIRKRTDHLKGIKIGIMGCIVNGPGEMADADYGYVGSGKDKITLYKGKEVVKRNISAAKALDELINVIREDGNWIEKSEIHEQ